MNHGNRLSPEDIVTASLWHRTMETLYDVLHDAPDLGLKETQRGSRACLATLILVNQKRKPNPFPYPIIMVFPRNT